MRTQTTDKALHAMRYAVACAMLLVMCATARGADVAATLVWRNGQPGVEINAPADVLAGDEVRFDIELRQTGGRSVWRGEAVGEVVAGKAVHAAVTAQRFSAGQGHEMVVSLAGNAAAAMTHTLHFAAPDDKVQAVGLLASGAYPEATMHATVQFAPVRHRHVEELELNVSVRDADENIIVRRNLRVPTEAKVFTERVDVTPPAESIGPYTMEVRVEEPLIDLYYNWSGRFAFANALVPVTSMQSSAPVWFTSSADPARINNYNSPYRNELTQAMPFAFDEKVTRSGNRSLRLDYKDGGSPVAFADQALPGRPISLRLWVKGNGSDDRLWVHFRDRTDWSKAAHQRHANTSRVNLGPLNFTDWREFRVPVLGAGMQAATRYDDAKAIATPIHLMAVSVQPRKLGKDETYTDAQRSVWVDDVRVETQAPSRDRVTMELLANTPDQRLERGATLAVTVGNGAGADIDDGRVRIVVRDAADETIQQQVESAPMEAGGFWQGVVSLDKAADAATAGPVNVDVTFDAPSQPGARITQRMVLKHAKSAGVVLDFERAERFSGFAGGAGAATAAPGANKSQRALVIETDGDAEKRFGALLHPALPGMVDRVRMQVRADGAAVTLVPVLIDAGLTNVGELYANEFYMQPVRIEPGGWRAVEFAAPAVPAYYDDDQRAFLRKPWYPLNLALLVMPIDGKAATLRVDDVAVTTHLPAERRITAEVVYTDETRLHAPGAAVDVALTNFAPENRAMTVTYTLAPLRGGEATTIERQLTLPAGRITVDRVIDKLANGLYRLDVRADGAVLTTGIVQCVDAKAYFGATPRDMLVDEIALRKAMDLTRVRQDFDWDNLEPVPGVFHYNWLNNDLERAAAGGAYEIDPVLGFASDYAGGEAQPDIEAGRYERYMGNYLQAPQRMADFSRYLREVMREYHGRFPRWVFWDNPDLNDGLQYLTPAQYTDMIALARRWLDVYDDTALLVAGGFNYDAALPYLDQFDAPADLPFDRFAVRMNIGELSPEAADLEGFLDELNELLKLRETERAVEVSELDWPVGSYVSAAEQAAYHARASLILASRGADRHRYDLVNVGNSFDGYGVFYRPRYGNSDNVQTHQPVHVPKPAYYALKHARVFLDAHTFVGAAHLPDRDLSLNRAYLYRTKAGAIAVALWRTDTAARAYTLPQAWRKASAVDAFGFALPVGETINLTALPVFLTLPAGVTVEQALHDVRTMPPADGRDAVYLDLHIAEADSAKRADHSSTGTTQRAERRGRVPAGRRVAATFIDGIEREQFTFTAQADGHVLLKRLWHSDEAGQRLYVSIDDGDEVLWDLQPQQASFHTPGVRESALVLRDIAAGSHTVAVRYEKPGNCAGWRVEPIDGDALPLTALGLLTAAQGRGEAMRDRNVRGGELTIGKQTYPTGLGTHAVSLVDVALGGRFTAFEVTVGVDGSTAGRGSVAFEVIIDGKPAAQSGPMTGFSEPITLRVDNLSDAQHLLLVVRDGDDGDTHDLANWVDGRLLLK